MQVCPLTGQYAYSKILRLTDEGQHLTINAFFTQFGLTVQEKKRVLDQNRVVQSLFVDNKLNNI